MRLLIVEDDAPLASGLRRMLEAEGYAVDVAGRGEEVVLAASQDRFDTIYYRVTAPDGRPIAGEADLPWPPELDAREGLVTYDAKYKGRKVR